MTKIDQHQRLRMGAAIVGAGQALIGLVGVILMGPLPWMVAVLGGWAFALYFGIRWRMFRPHQLNERTYAPFRDALDTIRGDGAMDEVDWLVAHWHVDRWDEDTRIIHPAVARALAPPPTREDVKALLREKARQCDLAQYAATIANDFGNASRFIQQYAEATRELEQMEREDAAREKLKAELASQAKAVYVDGGMYWTCTHCTRTSHHPRDVEFHYCGACHHFCDDVDSFTQAV